MKIRECTHMYMWEGEREVEVRLICHNSQHYNNIISLSLYSHTTSHVIHLPLTHKHICTCTCRFSTAYTTVIPYMIYVLQINQY